MPRRIPWALGPSGSRADRGVARSSDPLGHHGGRRLETIPAASTEKQPARTLESAQGDGCCWQRKYVRFKEVGRWWFGVGRCVEHGRGEGDSSSGKRCVVYFVAVMELRRHLLASRLPSSGIWSVGPPPPESQTGLPAGEDRTLSIEKAGRRGSRPKWAVYVDSSVLAGKAATG